SAEFESRQLESAPRFDYTRVSNPTTRLLEEKIAVLEGGDACRAFGSGMAAISAAIMSCVKAGDHVVCVDTVYGPTRRLLDDLLTRFGVETTYVGGTRLADFENSIRPGTRLFYVESPSSLVFGIQDLAGIARLARARKIRTIW